MTAVVQSEEEEQRGSTPGRLERVGRFSASRPALIIGVWLVVLIVVVIGQRVGGGIYSDNVNLAGTQSYVGLTLLTSNDPAASGYSGLVVIHSTRGKISSYSSEVSETYTALTKLPNVLSVSDPLSQSSPDLSANGATAYFNMHFSVLPKTLGSSYVGRLHTATSSLVHAGVEVEFGGGLDQLTRPSSSDKRSEAVGFLVALVVLAVGFGSLLGAGLPVLTALASVVIGVSILGLVAGVITFGTASPTLALMIGLGVGIDYAVFLSTRFRQLIMDGVDPVTAAGRTVGSSGRAVIVAATSVSVALFGLYASGITFIGQLGFAAVFGVVTAATGAITLVPAGLGLVGRRIDRYSIRRPVAEGGSENDGWHRYARTIGARPWTYFVVGAAILAILAIPLLSIQIGHVGDGADPPSYTDRRAYDLIASGFGVGANDPFTVVVDVRALHGSASTLATTLQRDISSVKGVAHASAATLTPNGALLVENVVPSSGPQDQATTSLYTTLLHTTIPSAIGGDGAIGHLTGSTASQIQFAQAMSSKLIVIISVVVLTAFLLILAAFRSLWLAVKAAVMNLMSIGAAYGVVVAVFQWGWGRSLIGVSENVPVESYVPMMMFAIVFGLSMDYEIFLLSRVKESWDATGDNSFAVAAGLASTARVITCAALIMISVFAAFVGSTNVVIKMLAVGLASSVLIDASIVRLILVPATMNLLGRSNWWMPKWLERVVPHLDVE